MVRRGLSERYGSWKTICRCLRNGLSCLGPSRAISASPTRMAPSLGSISRITQRATVDLPEPLSPTMPSVRPGWMLNATSCAAWTSRRRPGNPPIA
ncbi:Uncharacterised protein [Bordetella pertussis]|nr:Uncharacterised protein [Bordetella pertussis]CFW00441.1 Uncharacterised protein [Bordetella pertussis]CFW31448.1 Uncharacterised protein [Bordetella pertussis]